MFIKYLKPKSIKLVSISMIGCILTSTAYAANPAACNPQVRSALLEASRTGAEGATGIINNPISGIGLPKSVFELGCLDNLYNLQNINILYNPNSAIDGIMNQVKQRICNIAQDYYSTTVSKPFDEAVFNSQIPTVTGLQTSFPKTQKQELPTIDIVPPKDPNSSNSNNSNSLFEKFF